MEILGSMFQLGSDEKFVKELFCFQGLNIHHGQNVLLFLLGHQVLHDTKPLSFAKHLGHSLSPKHTGCM